MPNIKSRQTCRKDTTDRRCVEVLGCCLVGDAVVIDEVGNLAPAIYISSWSRGRLLRQGGAYGSSASIYFHGSWRRPGQLLQLSRSMATLKVSQEQFLPGVAVGAGSCQARSCSGALEPEWVGCPFHLQSSPIEGSWGPHSCAQPSYSQDSPYPGRNLLGGYQKNS